MGRQIVGHRLFRPRRFCEANEKGQGASNTLRAPPFLLGEALGAAVGIFHAQADPVTSPFG